MLSWKGWLQASWEDVLYALLLPPCTILHFDLHIIVGSAEPIDTELLSTAAGFIGALFSPGFNVTTNDSFHKLPPGVKPLTVSLPLLLKARKLDSVLYNPLVTASIGCIRCQRAILLGPYCNDRHAKTAPFTRRS